MDLSRPTTSASPFRITCLAASPAVDNFSTSADKLIFAGGFNGEYAFANLSVNNDCSRNEGFVSHDLVTHINTSHDRISGLPRAVFCSNDRKLRVLDVQTTRFTDVFHFEHALNCSASSPDGRLRIVVGDSNEALVTDADRGGTLVALKEHTDHVFACAWSPSGRYVATGAEDGFVAIWDARNWKRPVETKPCFMSSSRSMNFADDDSLIIAEEEDVVSIYESRHWQLAQSIRFFGSIAGMALVDGGNELVIANSDRTVGGLLSFHRSAQGLCAGICRDTMACNYDESKCWEPRRRCCRHCGSANQKWSPGFNMVV
jgi:WD40 repeat protein